MRISPQWSRLMVTTTVALAVAGCAGGQSDGLPREPVSGNVTLDGAPMPTGSITFVPIGFEGPPVGAEIKDGAYSIPRQDGPIPGPHTVGVYASKPTGRKYPDPDDPTVMIDEMFEIIPPKYNLKSELKAEIKKGESNSFDYTLTGEIKTPPKATRR
jgi:hypothetical protein